jgi:hypothetical protein
LKDCDQSQLIDLEQKVPACETATIDLPYSGPVLIEFELVGFTPSLARIHVVAGEESLVELDPIVHRIITVKVVDDHGQAVAGAKVKALPTRLAGWTHELRKDAPVERWRSKSGGFISWGDPMGITDPEGRFTVVATSLRSISAVFGKKGIVASEVILWTEGSLPAEDGLVVSALAAPKDVLPITILLSGVPLISVSGIAVSAVRLGMPELRPFFEPFSSDALGRIFCDQLVDGDMYEITFSHEGLKYEDRFVYRPGMTIVF